MDQREVIVVVDGGSDDTAMYLRGLRTHCRLTVIEQANRGPAGARNAGIKAATGDLVLFLDDDVLCSPSLVSNHVTMQTKKPGVVFGPFVVSPESASTPAMEWIRDGRAKDIARFEREATTGSKFDLRIQSNCSVPRTLLLQHKGFDESLRTHEDLDLALRLWNSGVQFAFEPSCPVHELYSKSPEHLIRVDAPLIGKSGIAMCRMHVDYRGASRAAKLREKFLGKLLLWLTCRPPISPEPVLRIPYAISETLWRVAGVRYPANLLFRSRFTIAELRAAAEAAGSWREFCLLTTRPPTTDAGNAARRYSSSAL